jgi:hypothetical protein
MHKVTYRLFAISFIFFSGILFISCNRNNSTTASDKAELLSFGPTGSKIGDTLRFIGVNLNKVTSIKFTGDSAGATIEQKNFTMQTSTEIRVIVPAAAEKGYVTLKTPDGNIVTKTQLNLSVAITETSITQQARPGSNITINGDYLNWVDRITFAKNKTVQTFVSKTKNQLIVTVPYDAETGPLDLHYSGTDSSDIITKDTLSIILPVITSFSPAAVSAGDTLTITGTDLDMVSSVTFENADPVTSFVSQSSTEIKVVVPTGILRGKLILGIRNSSHTVQSSDILEIKGALPPPTLALPIYLDAVTTNWNGWIGGGWGGTKNFSNTSPVREGNNSIQIDYVGGYGSPLQLGGANIDLTPYTTFKISIYGAPGSGGKKVTIAFNQSNGKFNVTLVEGQWTDYTIPISTLTTSTTLNEIWVQEFSGTGGFTIYVDAIGLN